MAENTSAGDYVKAPESVSPEAPVEDQLGELKIAAKGKIHEFADKANEAANDPSNKAAADETIQRDVDLTAQDAANSYTKAQTQLGDAFNTLESTGKQVAGQLGTASEETAEQAQHRSEEAKGKVQGGQSALQQGVAKVHDAVSSGVAAANQKLQEGSATTGSTGTTGTTGTNTTTTESRDLNKQTPSTLFQSLGNVISSTGNVISSTAQSMKDAYNTPSPTANASHATPTTTNIPVTHPPAQSVAESFGQTAAALRDALKSTWFPAPPEHGSAAPVTDSRKPTQ